MRIGEVLARTSKRIANAWSRHGLFGFLRLIPRNIAHFGARGLFRAREEPLSEFDSEHGIETTRTHAIGSLDVANGAGNPESVKDAEQYQAIYPSVFRGALAELNLDHAAFTFIDFGSGKGRALLLASEYPFRRIIGVEFSPQLQEIALHNIASFRHPNQRCGDIESRCQDAATFEPPAGPLVCFFYNPFGATTLAKVLGNIELLLQRQPAVVYVIYVNPEHRRIFESLPMWSLLHEGRQFAVYRTGTPNSAG